MTYDGSIFISSAAAQALAISRIEIIGLVLGLRA